MLWVSPERPLHLVSEPMPETHLATILNVYQLNALQSLAREVPCSNGNECQDWTCCFGHRCPFGERCNKGKNCRLSGDAHHRPDGREVGEAATAHFHPVQFQSHLYCIIHRISSVYHAERIRILQRIERRCAQGMIIAVSHILTGL